MNTDSAPSIDEAVARSARRLLEAGSFPSIRRVHGDTSLSVPKITASVKRLDRAGSWPARRRRSCKPFNQTEKDLLRKLFDSADRTSAGIPIMSSAIREFYKLTGRFTSHTQVRSMLGLRRRWTRWKPGMPLLWNDSSRRFGPSAGKGKTRFG